jgi:hypothetical protein
VGGHGSNLLVFSFGIRYYDRVLSDITCTITSCTEETARRYGRFLSETLQLIGRFHASKVWQVVFGLHFAKLN